MPHYTLDWTFGLPQQCISSSTSRESQEIQDLEGRLLYTSSRLRPSTSKSSRIGYRRRPVGSRNDDVESQLVASL